MNQEVKIFHVDEWLSHTHSAVLMFDIMMPVEVKVNFTPEVVRGMPDSVVWTLSRDMMVDAILHRKAVGIGDIKMRPLVTEVGPMLVLVMNGWDDLMSQRQDTMELATPLAVVENFLRKTLAIRPQHTEDLVMGKQIDAGLVRLLA